MTEERKNKVSNKELREAWDFVEHTGTSIFLTGKAGTGKTTFLKTVREHSSKRMIVVAPTGVAAINAGGSTIHSFFQLPFTPFVPGITIRDRYDFSKVKRRIIASLDMLVIDEISMVRADLLDAVDSVLRRYRDATQPFGGVQLLMIGDLQQLTPVVRPQEEQILGQYYTTPYFFGSKALAQTSYVTIQLTHVYRQQDDAFISILNHIRDGKPTAGDMDCLNARCNPAFIPKPGDGYIRLTTHNRMADSYNENELLKLGTKRYSFTAKADGDFPAANYPAEETLVLKMGAQVMFIKNDSSGKHQYYNGRIGHIVAIGEDTIEVMCPGDKDPIKVEPETWENTKYTINPTNKTIEPKVVGTFKQYPLRLAWAITIHKSQGLTFERAIIDAAFSFAPGQVYVALSRCKSLEGLVLASRIGISSIINDASVADYISHQQQAARESIARLPELKAAYYRNLLLDLFNFNPLYAAEQMLSRTMVEFFRSAKQVCDFHGEVMANIKKQVVDVAYKWQNVIRQTTAQGLLEEAFVQRVRRSADYFAAALKEQVPKLLQVTKQQVKSNNKHALQLLDERFKDFYLLYLAKEKLLDAMATANFSTASYLQAKQEALLDAMEAIDPASTRKRTARRSATGNPYGSDSVAEPAPKREKGDSGRQTMAMLRQGKTPEQIAAGRNLALSTIYGHLAEFIKKGELTADKVIPPEKVRAIRHAMAQLPEDASADDIIAVCSKDINSTNKSQMPTKDEVYLMLKSKKRL